MKILVATELGGGSGHLIATRNLVNYLLTSKNYKPTEIAVYLPEYLKPTERVGYFGEGVSVREVPSDQSSGYSANLPENLECVECLAQYNEFNERKLKSHKSVNFWISEIQKEKPDAVYGEFAPSLKLACHCLGVKFVGVDTPWSAGYDFSISHRSIFVNSFLAFVNSYTKHYLGRVYRSLAEYFHDAGVSVLGNATLDPFAAMRHGCQYLGFPDYMVLPTADCEPLADTVYCYSSAKMPSLKPILSYCIKNKKSVFLVAPNAGVVPKYLKEHVSLIDFAENSNQMLKAEFVVSSGYYSTIEALLAGKSVIGNIVTYEQALTFEHLDAIGFLKIFDKKDMSLFNPRQKRSIDIFCNL